MMIKNNISKLLVISPLHHENCENPPPRNINLLEVKQIQILHKSYHVSCKPVTSTVQKFMKFITSGQTASIPVGYKSTSFSSRPANKYMIILLLDQVYVLRLQRKEFSMWTVLIGTLVCMNVISGEDHHLLGRSTERDTHAINKVG